MLVDHLREIVSIYMCLRCSTHAQSLMLGGSCARKVFSSSSSCSVNAKLFAFVSSGFLCSIVFAFACADVILPKANLCLLTAP